jgi:hypothetical protein
VGERAESVDLQFEEEVVVVERVADVRRRGGRERWKWQSDSSLAILNAAVRVSYEVAEDANHAEDDQSGPHGPKFDRLTHE